MKIIEIKTPDGISKILIGEKIENVGNYIKNKRTVIITDVNLNRLYSEKFPQGDMIVIGTGEKIKNLDTVNDIYKKFLDLQVDRSSFILGIGGGIVCDTAGFAASTYMRGLDFGFVSTSLLAQVDASIGGKNGVNFLGYKNLVGTFNQPSFVICDIDMLDTLPDEHYKSGLGELLKFALVGPNTLFKYLEKHYESIWSKDKEVLEKAIYDSVKIKAGIVMRDEKDRGERIIFNLGHTFGHAIEKTMGITHGESVAVGTAITVSVCREKGMLTENEEKRILKLIKNLNLPFNVAFDKEKIKDAMRKDKKREGDMLNYVFLNGIGKTSVKKVSFKELDKIVDKLI